MHTKLAIAALVLFLYLTAMEFNYANQMDNSSLDAVIVPLPWSVNVHTNSTIVA